MNIKSPPESGGSSSPILPRAIRNATRESVGARKWASNFLIDLAWVPINILQALILIAWSILLMGGACIISIFSSEAPLWLARHVYSPFLIAVAGAKMSVVRPPNLKPGQPYIFVMNHQSMFDIAVACACIPINIRFIAKRILLFVPVLGWYMWRTKMVTVDRSNPKQAYRSLEGARDQLRDGISILAYPEGTRHSDGYIRPFRRGVFVLAQASQLPIVPVVIEGSGRLLPSGTFKVRPTEVKVSFGEPISTRGVDNNPEAIDAFRDQVRASMIELHRTIGGLGALEERDNFPDGTRSAKF